MRQSHVDLVSEPASSNVPRILAAFVIGMAATFAGALMYSSSQQRLQSVGAVNASASAPIAAPQQHPAPAGANQQAVENSTGDEQQQTAATSASIQEPTTAPDHLSKERTKSQTVGASSLASKSSAPVSAPNTMKRYPVEQHVAPSARIYNEPQPAPVQPVQFALHPNMPAAPQDGSVEMAQSAPPVLPLQNRHAVPPQPGPQVITAQPGTRIRVRLAEPLSSDRNRAGDTFRAVVDSPVVVNGAVVAPAGANVFGRIADARKAPLLGGRADLTLTLTDITTADGHLARIATDGVQQVGARSGIVNTAKMATGAAIGAVTGALDGAAAGAGISAPLRNDVTNGFFATKRTVAFPAGTQVVFSLTAPLNVTEQVNR